jgi:hypothetical protein
MSRRTGRCFGVTRMPKSTGAARALWCLCLCLAFRPGAWAAPAAHPPAVAPSDLRNVRLTLRDLGQRQPLELRGADDRGADLSLGLRADEVVVAARLRLRFSYSPALLPELSHLKVSLNGEPASAIALPRDAAGREVIRELELNPAYFTDYNHLRLELVGHYTLECEDRRQSSLWATVSEQSELELVVRTLELKNELALLPAPFFDRHDSRRLELPVVLPAHRERALLHAAGIAASWFGALADYRGARFPVADAELPSRHALVFATNAAKPAGLALADVAAPTVRILDHPRDPRVKLLLFMGRDAAELERAVLGVTLGQAVLSGPGATVGAVRVAPRAPYDAPRWLRTDRPVRIGELVDSPAELEAWGRSPPPLAVHLRPPPDLMTWNQNGVPLDLHYRYTPPAERDPSALTIGLNERLVRAVRLRPDTESGAVDRLMLPFAPGGAIGARERLLLPMLELGADNALTFQFALESHRTGACREQLPDLSRAAVDPESTLDLTGFGHYTAMPNLAIYANAGFPFTRLADLAETAIVLPPEPTSATIEELLFQLGRFGRLTGVPATAFRLVSGDEARALDADLLVLGGAAPGASLGAAGATLALELADDERRFRLPMPLADRPRGAEPERGSRGEVAVRAGGPFAALIGYESPARRGRSVVALLGGTPAAAESLAAALEDAGHVAAMRGELVIIRGGAVESYAGDARYFVGSVPWWTRLGFQLSRHPWLVTLFALALVLGGAVVGYGWLRRRASERLGEASG